ncbi:uncharacterized protein LOC141600966 [Silene latifolia]|uniref:uncharacterized protein LOC141600966 n=1 Tax=Silene latifolia TaxID=37657 RepID=UPI003D7736B8
MGLTQEKLVTQNETNPENSHRASSGVWKLALCEFWTGVRFSIVLCWILGRLSHDVSSMLVLHPSFDASLGLLAPHSSLEIMLNDKAFGIDRSAWTAVDSGSPAFRVARKLARVRGSVKKWTLDKKAEWQEKWDEFDRKLEQGINTACMGGGEEEYTRVHEELQAFAAAAAVYWKQRAKVKWTVEGDTCTKFFFNWVKGRAGRNLIHGLRGEDGQWRYDDELVGSEFQRFYMNLYQSSRNGGAPRDTTGIEYALSHVQRRVAHDEADRLSRPFTAKEVRTAVFQMGALKAPGPDGIPACFYQKCWSLVKHDFTTGVLSILNSGRVLKELNRTFIALIPKTEAPEDVSDYRPISLCNVLMRVVTKCIANRLGKVMGSLVSESQNAFLPGRSISDNILLAHEAIHHITRHKKGVHGRCAFKADMSKAYDRIKWEFLEMTLVKFGFPFKLVQLIMNCVNSVSYEILYNGKPLPQFRPQCGLRQGDPLSPYLFLLCMEVLSANIDQARDSGRLEGFKLCRGVRPMTHLFFADDAVFFFKDKGKTADHLKSIIDGYCEASGQILNPTKSGLIFSPNTTLAKAQQILKVFNVRANRGIGKYLGIPAEFQESKKGIFQSLIDQITKRISSWNGIFLSPAGRLTLISSVLSNLSNYFLSVFKIPVSVAKKINSLLTQFWWTGCKLGTTVHWCSKNFLSLPKGMGGLGIRNIECLNQALLAKHGWRLVSGENSLFSRIFRQKVFGDDMADPNRLAKKVTNCSWGVRSILHGFQAIKDYLGWKPGRDSRLNIWVTRWVGGACPEPRDQWLGAGDMHLANLQVRDLLLPNGEWNELSIRALIREEYAARILAIRVRDMNIADVLFWPFTKDGVYTVKSGYGLIFEEYMNRKGTTRDKTRIGERERTFCQKQLWTLPVPNSWKILVWRIITNTLSVGKEFHRRQLAVDVLCSLCGESHGCMETLEHLFRDCEVSARIWAGSSLGIRVGGAELIGMADWIIDWIRYLWKQKEGRIRVINFIAILWGLWTIRNKVKFDGMTNNPHVLADVLFGSIKDKVCILKDQLEGKGMIKRLEGDGEEFLDQRRMDIRSGVPVQLIGCPDRCNVIRVKVDAGWERNYVAAFGWVAYDRQGQERMRRQVKTKAETALQAEALGVRDVLLWASAEGWLHLDISSDCLQLINELAGIGKVDHLIAGILEDIHKTASCFHCLCFSFIPRTLNSMAHGLARQAIKM